jgi:hypothetical protein
VRSNRGAAPYHSPPPVPARRRFWPQRVPEGSKKSIGNNALRENFLENFLGNDAFRNELDRLHAGRAPGCKLVKIAKEHSMRNHLLAISTIVAAMSAPIAAQAQNTVGVAGSGTGTVVVDDGTVGIAADQRPAFREYIVQQRVPKYTIPDRVMIGAILPESGVTLYDVPQSFGETPYRYTVVNGNTVLVEPRSRRIVQLID